MPIPVFRPFIKRRDMDAVLTSLVADAVNTGAETEAFVNEVLEILDFDAGIGLRELPRGIACAIAALELPTGSRVGLGALAPCLYAEALLHVGLQPVLIDCHEHNPCLNHAAVKTEHQANPLAALIVHFPLGHYPDLPALRELGIPVLADITESFHGAMGEDEPTDYGDIAILGLESNGMLTAAGGVLVLAKTRKEGNALLKASADYPREVLLQDMNAALGRSQLKQMDYFLQRRREMRELLHRSALRGRHQLLVPLQDFAEIPYSFALLLKSSVAEVQAFARKKNIDTALAFSGSVIHTNQNRDDFEPMAFPNAYGFMMRCLLFPLYPGMTSKELEMIEKVVASLP